MAAKSIIGAKVRLLRDIQTKGGVKFKAGLLMRVVHSDSGGLWLRCYKRGWQQDIRHVDRSSDIEVVEWPTKED